MLKNFLAFICMNGKRNRERCLIQCYLLSQYYLPLKKTSLRKSLTGSRILKVNVILNSQNESHFYFFIEKTDT